MHRNVSPLIGQRRFNRGHEDSLAADLVQWGRKFISLGPDDLHVNLESGMLGAQSLNDQIRLAQCQR